jgi:hypothetical protein
MVSAVAIPQKQNCPEFVLGVMRNVKNKTVKKENLPSKVCKVCNRPFTWRKKWERDWDKVLYCSDKCKQKKDSSL